MMDILASAAGRPLVDLRPRAMLARLMVVLFLAALMWRATILMTVRTEHYSRSGEQNLIQAIETPHPRGMIYDRFGRLLVGNRPSLSLYATPYFLRHDVQRSTVLNRVATLLDIPEMRLEEVRTRIESAKGWDRFTPVPIRTNLSAKELDAIESERALLRLDGLHVSVGHRRRYFAGPELSHTLGYVREIGPDMLRGAIDAGNPLQYRRGDFVGRRGVESGWENVLRGVDGSDYFVVDARGRRLSDEQAAELLGQKFQPRDAKPGHNLYLTIDADLQRRATEAFHGRAGAAAVLEVSTGDILAMVSVPGFDPNRVSADFSAYEKAKLDQDPLHPWINRVTQGQYAPGSIFKAVTALAALQSKAISPKEKIYCPGHYRFGNRTLRCHHASGHGHVDLKKALKVSCDTYFYELGARMGIDPIASMGKKLGFGLPMHTGLLEERSGVMPDEAWHDRVDAKTGGYQRGMALNTAIGQGAVVVSPLQVAMVYRSIATRGQVQLPRLVHTIADPPRRRFRKYFDPESQRVETDVEQIASGSFSMIPHRVLEPVDLDKQVWDEVWAGLHSVVHEPGGTAYYRRIRNVDYEVMGKTGTAQVKGMGKQREKSADLDYWVRDHAWFAAIAPADNPAISVVVLNEHGGHGSSGAAPIAMRIIEAYMDLQQERQVVFPNAASQSNSAANDAQEGVY